MASKPRHEKQVLWLTVLGGLPAVALAIVLLWIGDFAPRAQWTLGGLVIAIWLICALAVRERVVRPLQTVSNVLAALRERDYTLRARGSNPEDALGLLLLELNSLGDDMRSGLGVIASRSESLSRLMAGYARLARLPPPRLEPVVVPDWVRRVVALETRRPVSVHAGPDVTIQADGGQLDQLLINLVRNAVDATLEASGSVEVGWETRNGQLEVWVRDDGPGLADTANLFVPF